MLDYVVVLVLMLSAEILTLLNFIDNVQKNLKKLQSHSFTPLEDLYYNIRQKGRINYSPFRCLLFQKKVSI